MATRSGKFPPVAKVPVLAWLTDEEKMGLTTRELATVDKIHQGQYAVRITVTKENFWKAEIVVDESGRTYEVDTTRGMTKGWRHMELALNFVKDNCPNARHVCVEFGDWTLEVASKEGKK